MAKDVHSVLLHPTNGLCTLFGVGRIQLRVVNGLLLHAHRGPCTAVETKRGSESAVWND